MADKKVVIREEREGDIVAIYRVNELAFGQPGEAALVDQLREDGLHALSLVALLDGEVVGHILFSPVEISDEGLVWVSVGLGPMAVLPDHQRKGIGTLLIQRGLKELKKIGFMSVVVLGHPEYYPKFGFVTASKHGLRCKWEVPDEAWMVCELQPGGLAGVSGLVEYAPAFDGV